MASFLIGQREEDHSLSPLVDFCQNEGSLVQNFSQVDAEVVILQGLVKGQLCGSIGLFAISEWQRDVVKDEAGSVAKTNVSMMDDGKGRWHDHDLEHIAILQESSRQVQLQRPVKARLVSQVKEPNIVPMPESKVSLVIQVYTNWFHVGTLGL